MLARLRTSGVDDDRLGVAEVAEGNERKEGCCEGKKKGKREEGRVKCRWRNDEDERGGGLADNQRATEKQSQVALETRWSHALPPRLPLDCCRPPSDGRKKVSGSPVGVRPPALLHESTRALYTCRGTEYSTDLLYERQVQEDSGGQKGRPI